MKTGKNFRSDILSGTTMNGIWANLGSSNAVTIAGCLGFDWILLDTEHGLGDQHLLQSQITALAPWETAPIVRIPSLCDAHFKKVLDLGAAGIMVPQIRNASEAGQVASAMRYPPEGHRGVSRINPVTNFGIDADQYLATANQMLVTILQIETLDALDNLDEIAAVKGIDVLFVGPTDLTYSLGIPGQLDHSLYREALQRIVRACRRNSKAAGILCGSTTALAEAAGLGFSFVAMNSDAGILATAMGDCLKSMQTLSLSSTPADHAG